MTGDTTVNPCPHVCIACGGCSDCCECIEIGIRRDGTPQKLSLVFVEEELNRYWRRGLSSSSHHGKSVAMDLLMSELVWRGRHSDTGSADDGNRR